MAEGERSSWGGFGMDVERGCSVEGATTAGDECAALGSGAMAWDAGMVFVASGECSDGVAPTRELVDRVEVSKEDDPLG